MCSHFRYSHFRTIAIIVLLAALLALAPLPVQAQIGPQYTPWYELKDGEAQVHLYFFWSKTCPHCQHAHPFVEALPQQFPWLTLHSLELTEHPENVEQYAAMAAGLGEQAQYVPAFFVCGAMSAGYDDHDTSGAALVQSLEQCHATALAQLPKPASEPASKAGANQSHDREGVVGIAPATPIAAPAVAPALTLPLIGALDAQALSLPVFTLVVAGLDAFNPCAFFVLMFLLSLMVHAGSRRRMALIGGVFVLTSGLLYFVFMAAWLNIFLVVGELAIITTIAGLVAIVIALINIKDFFWFKQGVSLSIPERAKPGLYQRSRNLLKASSLPAMLAGTVVLALAANSYELLCTSGFPMVYTRTLTLHDLPPATFYAYLALYNLIYVTPLLVIVAIFTARFGARKLSEEEGRVLKLLSGLMMLLLGLVLVIAPSLLNDIATALGLLAITLLLTGALVWADRHWLHPVGRQVRRSR
jgi:hypothetical protein